MERIRNYVLRFLEERMFFTNNIDVFVLYESKRLCVYFFEYKDCLYHVVAGATSSGEIAVSLSIQTDFNVYEGYRYSGCEISEKEKEYIKNDVLVVAGATSSGEIAVSLSIQTDFNVYEGYRYSGCGISEKEYIKNLSEENS